MGTLCRSPRYKPRSWANTFSVAWVTSSFRRTPNMAAPRFPVR